MKSQIIILLFLLSPLLYFAQEDTTHSKKIGINDIDSSKKRLMLKPALPPRALIIKMKDLKEIQSLKNSPFNIIDDTVQSTEDLASGLSEEELASYKKNKKETKQLLIPPVSEEETYPSISTIRKILGVAKTAGVIIILILSLL